MKAHRRLDVFATLSNIYHYTPTNSHKTLTNYLSEFSGRITLCIGENPMKILAVVFEFIARRQTDRRGGGLCFIICIDIIRFTSVCKIVTYLESSAEVFCHYQSLGSPNI